MSSLVPGSSLEEAPALSSSSSWFEAAFEKILDACHAVERAVERFIDPLAEEFRVIEQDLKDFAGELADGRENKALTISRSSTSALLRSVKEIFVGQNRQEQLASLEPSSPVEQNSEVRAAIRSLIVGAATVAVTFLALTYDPRLLIVSAAGLLYQVGFFFRAAYRGLVEERRINIYAFNVIIYVGAFFSGSVMALTVTIWLGGLLRWILAMTEDLAQRSLHGVFGRQPRTVWLVMEDAEIQVPFEQLQVRDTIVISAGDMIPVDGEVIRGMGSVDQRMLTGEAQPIDRGIGDRVLASTVILQGRLYVRVEHSGNDTVASQVERMLADTADFKRELTARSVRHQDRMTTPFLMLGGATAAVWGLDSAYGVLWNIPGFRMYFFGPLTMLSFMHIASKKGILLKEGRALERLRTIDTVVFDKTGTLTLEQPTVGEIVSFSDCSTDEILQLALAAEHGQTHPIARAIQHLARQQAISVPAMEEPEVAVGFGVKAVVAGRQILVGSERLMNLHQVTLPPSAEWQQSAAHEQGRSLVFVSCDGQLLGALEICPTVRPEAATLVAELARRGKRVLILSGDHEAPTRSLAAQLGVGGYFAGVLPEDKARVIEQLREEGRVICFVGDGINDSIAMQRADVSVSMRGATSIATTVAQVVLMSGDLELMLPLFDLAERFERYMRINRLASSIPPLLITGGSILFGWSFMTAALLSQLTTPVALYSLFGPVMEDQADRAVVDPHDPQAQRQHQVSRADDPV